MRFRRVRLRFGVKIFICALAVIVLMCVLAPPKLISKNLKIEEKGVTWINGERKRDYVDYEYLKRESIQKGLGEGGVAAYLPPELEKERYEINLSNGYNGRLSDEIALNRSVKDTRHPKCKELLYLADLPNAAVVVPFHNEHWSTLLRTAFSVYNRSPKHLLKEIILVDDASTKDFLGAKLDHYLAENLPIARVIRLQERLGLIRARLEGAKHVTAEVLIILDAHTECNTNWLPPLLEPISKNYRTVVCPAIDAIESNTFEYRTQGKGNRGVFDWEFYYMSLPLTPEALANLPHPYENPVMAGGLFAISSKFFWELGGYDPGLDIWGGEQYELSFKVWQCHGALYDVPCSRIGHIYRNLVPFPNPRTNDFLSKNYRRVAEVWMDDYKQYLYKRNVKLIHTDTGDISEQLAVRERNKCKPFSWFMENVAFDLLKHFPFIDPPDYCNGTIQSLADPKLCIDSRPGKPGQVDTLRECDQSPHFRFKFSSHKDIRQINVRKCWDVSNLHDKHVPLLLYNCHKMLGNQLWKYDIVNKMLLFGKSKSHCLDSSISDREVFLTPCDMNSPTQKWKWSFVNEERLRNYDSLDPKV